jgi:hypothetical protein
MTSAFVLRTSARQVRLRASHFGSTGLFCSGFQSENTFASR